MTSHDHTKEWWENFWANPDQHFGEPRQSLIDVAEDYRRSLATQEIVTLVDIGSGNGRYAVPFAKRRFKVSVIEKSDKACKIIRQRAAHDNVTIDIKHEDIMIHHDESDQKFDVVFSSGLIEEIDSEDQTRAIARIKNLVKVDGLLILKYCLEIKDRGVTVEDGLVAPLFVDDPQWEVKSIETDPVMRQSIATIDFENQLRTETVIAFRRR